VDVFFHFVLVKYQVKRHFRFGYSAHPILFHDLSKSCLEHLFYNLHRSHNCLHDMLSSYVSRLESLRPRQHDRMSPACTSNLHKQSFIIRTLFDFISSSSIHHVSLKITDKPLLNKK